MDNQLLKTPLHELHQRSGAKFSPFAGYQMPLQYRGIIAEHNHTRHQAGLFDVSHMGQLKVAGANVTSALEKLLPLDLQQLSENSQVYGLLLNEKGGVMDDLIVTRTQQDEFYIVVNASRKTADTAHLCQHLGNDITVTPLTEQALLALQGPAAREVLKEIAPEVSKLFFLQGAPMNLCDIPCYVSCCGYTGEDGFEISLPATHAETIVELLLKDERVKLAGLGARDTLRLEAGLCLYGHELTETITPIEADLRWSISRSRRAGGDKAGGFIGDAVVLAQLQGQVVRKRYGLSCDTKGVILRAGTEIFNDNDGKNKIGEVTSGSFSPTLGHAIAMGYMQYSVENKEQQWWAKIRGKSHPVQRVKMPFVATRYHRQVS